jgi:flagellar biosynthesis protein FlhG
MAERLYSAEGRPVGRAVAIVSGKGGSGKTMLAVCLAQGLSQAGKKVLLVDADFGTGGLTYYLTFQTFNHAPVGLSDALTTDVSVQKLISEASHPLDETAWGLADLRLIPIGEHRRLDDSSDRKLAQIIRRIVDDATQSYDYLIVDCRGGIDRQSMAVCAACDDIVMVVETDATAVRASQHLSEAIRAERLGRKLLGFILNKVMDDPSSLARSANTFFETRYLGAVPFDIEATRAYVQGLLPPSNSLFSRQIFSILGRPPFSISAFAELETLAPSDFGTVTLRSPFSRLGGAVIGALALYAAAAMIIWWRYGRPSESHLVSGLLVYIMASVLLTFAAASEGIRSTFGRLMRAYTSRFAGSYKELQVMRSR